MKWSYGVMTCPSRWDNLFQDTHESLINAGFDSARIFLDDKPKLGALGNWIRGMWTLYLMDPLAERYAMFQDDILASRNLRQYLEACQYPKRGYLNLYTFPANQKLAEEPPLGYAPNFYEGWYKSDQRGRGAAALVFDREALLALFSQPYFVTYPTSPGPGLRKCGIDGMVLTALSNAGYSEFVHNPSLVQHVGDVSAIGNQPHAKAPSFRGDDFDCMSLLRREVLT